MKRIYRGMLYTELSRSQSNVTIQAHSPPWWKYTTTMQLSPEVWDACPEA